MVFIAATRVEGQRSMVVNPGREPEHACAPLEREALRFCEQSAADVLAGEPLLNVQAKQLGLPALGSELMRRAESDVSEPDQMTGELRDADSRCRIRDGFRQLGYRKTGQDLASDLGTDAFGGIGIQEHLHGKDRQAQAVAGNCRTQPQVFDVAGWSGHGDTAVVIGGSDREPAVLAIRRRASSDDRGLRPFLRS